MNHRRFNESLCELLVVHGAPISAVDGGQATVFKVWARGAMAYDWRRGRWLLRHGATLSELGELRCHRVYKERMGCYCREWMRVLAHGCGEDDKVKLQDVSREFERRWQEWTDTFVTFDR